MRIIDTVGDFVSHYQPTSEYLEQYYHQFQADYDVYFAHHCLHIETKKRAALKKHSPKLPELLPMRDLFLEHIPKILQRYEEMFDVKYTKTVRLLVGLYGSTAFVYQQYHPDVAFCLEKLPYNETYIKLIIAHEFGHVMHYLYNDIYSQDWHLVNWTHPYTWLLQEGIATTLSTLLVEARLDEHFAFEEDREWLDFAQKNESLIAKQFLCDMKTINDSHTIYKEWFSINGGKNFKQTRLGYYLGYQIVNALLTQYDIKETFTIWKEDDFLSIMEQQLTNMT